MQHTVARAGGGRDWLGWDGHAEEVGSCNESYRGGCLKQNGGRGILYVILRERMSG